MRILRIIKASGLVVVVGLATATCFAQTPPKQGQAKQATTPVTPSPKKATSPNGGADMNGSAKPESVSAEASTEIKKETAVGTEAVTFATSSAMPEAVALPQGTPFVPDLNLFGPTSAELRQRLTTALRNDPALSGSNLEANVSDDTISLTGSVRNAKDRVTARRIAESFATNRKVKEKITVAGSAAVGNSGQAASDVKAPKSPGTTQSAPTVQKPESPNRPVIDPASTQEKPKSGE